MESNYPGQWASTQLMAYYNDVGGLYVALDDAKGLPKFIDPVMEKDGVMMGLGHGVPYFRAHDGEAAVARNWDGSLLEDVWAWGRDREGPPNDPRYDRTDGGIGARIAIGQQFL